MLKPFPLMGEGWVGVRALQIHAPHPSPPHKGGGSVSNQTAYEHSVVMTLLDRQLVFSYVKAYVICLVSLLSLFIIIDLFNNLDNFMQHNGGLTQTLEHIGLYYSYKTSEIFDKLCEPIVLLAAMFTVAWVQRNNELIPLLSAGISTRRVVLPVILSACAVLGLGSLNQEIFLPKVDSYLLEHRDDPKGEKNTEVRGGYDSNGILIGNGTAIKKDQTVIGFVCRIPPSVTHNSVVTLQAERARWTPAESADKPGGWMLTGTIPAELDSWNRPDILEVMGGGRYFLYTKELDFETVTRNKNWVMFLPTWKLLEELDRGTAFRPSAVAVVFHIRLTRPILGVIIVVLGLSIILRDQNRNVYISAGLCVTICAVFFAACFASRHLGESEYLPPALAAWLPVLVFGPAAWVTFDAVHT